MQRPDTEIIRRILAQSKRVAKRLNRTDDRSEKNVEFALTLPLVSLTDHFFRESPIQDWYCDTFLKQGEREHEVAEPVFDEFVFHYRDKIQFNPDPEERHLQDGGPIRECFLWAVISDVDKDFYDYDVDEPPDGMDVEEYEERVFKNCRIKFLSVCAYFPTDPSLDFLSWQGFVGFKVDKYAELKPTGAQTIHCQPTEQTKELWEHATPAMNLIAADIFRKAQILWLYAKYGDKHIVEVVPTKTKTKNKAKKKSSLHKNRPWTTASGPHILFLDRMPATQKEGTGTHASPKPHRRRGHWKTLSHPRYRHHPQYQQKIYVKPSFVGPRQTTYEGNIYRLVQPLEERLS